MKESITIIEDLGYYHPSNANWSYGIHMIIDKTGARLYKDTFGGDARIREQLVSKGYTVNRQYAGKGSGVAYKWKDIKGLLDIESYTGKNY